MSATAAIKRRTSAVLLMAVLLGACSQKATPSATATPSALPTPSAAASPSPTPQPALTLTLQSGTTYQQIKGFGASGCWWAQDVGGWEADKVDTIVRLLFDTNAGIGLNIYRYNVGGGDVNNASDPWRRTETFESSPGKYDWTRDTNAVSIMKKAVAAGVDDVMFFANTPPGRMTVSGKTTGQDDGTSNLKPGMEDDFARYLVDIAQHFQDQGIPVKYISPLNEPQWDWKESNGQEGCHYRPDQVVAMAQALAKELQARGSDIRPSLIDSGKWFDDKYTVQLYKRLAGDPLVGPMMDHYAIHSYWSDDTDKKTTMKLLQMTGQNKPIWQSEWCQMENGRDLGMDAALTLAQTVHQDMTIGNCQAWIAWLAVSCYDYKDGLVYVDKSTHAILESKRMWALGNYSRFLRTGYQRVALDGDLSLLPTSAYVSPDGQTAVLVAINAGKEPVAASIAAQGYAACEAYETSDAHSLERVFQGKADAYVFPPRSITTLVLTR